MFFFNKKHTIAASGILQGAADHHSHILPGVDDGVETMDEALRILAAYEDLGIKKLWLTPHIMEDIPNSPAKLQARFEELKAAYKGNIKLHLAAEYMIDNHLHQLLQETNKFRHSSEGGILPEAFQETPPRFRGEVVEDRRGEKTPKECPLGPAQSERDNSIIPQETNKLRHSQCEGRWHEQSEVTEGSKTKNNCPSCVRGASEAEGDKILLPIGTSGKHILVETSYYNAPMRMNDTLQQIKSLGYFPLLAHPERYMYLNNADYTRLHSQGVRFQLNLASLAGGYGKAVKKKAEWLLSNGLYSVAGTDLHCEDAIEYITNCKLSKQTIEQVNQLLHNGI